MESLGYALCMSRGHLAENIRALRKHLGENQTEFAARFDAQQPDVSKWEKGSEPGGRTLAKLAQAAGRSIDQFIDEPWRPATSAAPDIPPTTFASADDETVEIGSLDLRFSMGPGTTIDDYIEEMPVRFALEFIRSFTRTPPARLRRAIGVGDSMLPTIHNSDAVWIDTTQTMLNLNDRIWAVSLFGAAAIKRLRPIGKGKVLVISDNPDIPNQEVDQEDLIIGGRVIRLERDI